MHLKSKSNMLESTAVYVTFPQNQMKDMGAKKKVKRTQHYDNGIHVALIQFIIPFLNQAGREVHQPVKPIQSLSNIQSSLKPKKKAHVKAPSSKQSTQSPTNLHNFSETYRLTHQETENSCGR